MKKIIALTAVLLLAFNSFCFAAVSSSGSRSSTPRSSTSTTSPAVRQTSPATPNSQYKPSAPAGSYSDKAPAAAQNKPGTTPANNPSSSGGFWRSAGMFGGGMLMGGLLSHMLGFGQMGAMSSIFGLLFNILILAAVIMGIRYLWIRFRNRDKRNM
ncbi:MAG: hypothetical protein ABFC57_02240 [Veillonellales bacterium]